MRRDNLSQDNRDNLSRDKGHPLKGGCPVPCPEASGCEAKARANKAFALIAGTSRERLDRGASLLALVFDHHRAVCVRWFRPVFIGVIHRRRVAVPAVVPVVEAHV